MAPTPIVSLFNGPLTTDFQPSQPLLLVDGTLALDFDITTDGGGGGGLTQVQWYLEYTSDNPADAAARWFREVSEEDDGDGAVVMAVVIRTFEENGGADLADGQHLFSTQFARRHRFIRLQLAAPTGAATVQVLAPFALPTFAPST